MLKKDLNKFNRSGITSFFYKNLSIEYVESVFPSFFKYKSNALEFRYFGGSDGTLVQVKGNISTRLAWNTFMIHEISPIEITKDDEILKDFQNAAMSTEHRKNKILFQDVVVQYANKCIDNRFANIECLNCRKLMTQIDKLKKMMQSNYLEANEIIEESLSLKSKNIESMSNPSIPGSSNFFEIDHSHFTDIKGEEVDHNELNEVVASFASKLNKKEDINQSQKPRRITPEKINVNKNNR
jgi:hypothetical protein